MSRFDEALAEAAEDMIFQACRSMKISLDDEAYVLARHRRTPDLFDDLLALGGNARDYVAMRLECRPPLAGRW